MTSLLKGIYVLERDIYNDIHTWGFPIVDNDFVSVLKARSGISAATQQGETDPDSTSFVTETPIVSRYQHQWVFFASATLSPSAAANYITTDDDDEMNTPGSKSTRLTIAIIAENYNIPGYSALCRLFVEMYRKHRTTNTILQPYLSILSARKFLPQPEQPSHWTWDEATFDSRLSLVGPVYRYFEHFGLETIIIYTAVVLKRRIVVFHPNPVQLNAYIRALPCLGAWHRSDATSLLHPFVSDLSNVLECDTILNQPGAIVGVTDNKTIQSNTNIWDIYVDAYNFSVEINPNARQYFSMTKAHKSLAETFLATFEKVTASVDANDVIDNFDDDKMLALAQPLIKTIANKTKDLLQLIKRVQEANNGEFVLDSEQSKQLVPSSFAPFIRNVAIAEGTIVE